MTIELAVTTDDFAFDVVRCVTGVVNDDNLPGASSFKEECGKLYEGQQYIQLLKFIISKTNLLLEQVPEEDVEGLFNLMAAYIAKVEKREERISITQTFVETVTADVEKMKVVRLKILTNLFNTLVEPSERMIVLEASLQYAMNSKEDLIFSDYLLQISKIVQKWDLPEAQKRKIYFLTHQILSQDDEKRALLLGVSKVAAAQDAALRFLYTFEDCPSGDLNSYKQEVITCATSIVKRPIETFSIQGGVRQMAALQMLKNDEGCKVLYDMIEIVYTKKLSDYLDFAKQNPKFFEEFGIDQESCLKNMRLLSLCSLASEYKAIPYTEIAKTLDVEISSVEGWVVEAVTVGLLDAKMDQMNEVATVMWYAWREFGENEWKNLAAKLESWNTNVSGVLQTIKDARSRRK